MVGTSSSLGRVGPGPQTLRKRVPVGPDRVRLPGLAGARHQRRPEDYGRHHPGIDRLRLWDQTDAIPQWVKVVCAIAIAAAPTSAAGASFARWQGPGRDHGAPGHGRGGASAAVILPPATSASRCRPLRSPAARSSASGVGRPGAQVRWGVAGRMVVAWMITLPAAGPGRRADVLDRPRHRRPRRRLPWWCMLLAGALGHVRQSRSARSTTTTSTRSGRADPTSANPEPRSPERESRRTPCVCPQGAWNVFCVGLLLGAGLPVVFALGVRLLSGRADSVNARTGPSWRTSRRARGPGSLGAVLRHVRSGRRVGLMVIVGAGIGKVVSFEHVFPTLVPKS